MGRNPFVLLTLVFTKERRRWLGECHELGTATHGRTLPEVERELHELVRLHLDALESSGQRKRFFRDHGIRVSHEKAPPEEVRRDVPVNRPMSFIQVHPVELPVVGHA